MYGVLAQYQHTRESKDLDMINFSQILNSVLCLKQKF